MPASVSRRTCPAQDRRRFPKNGIDRNVDTPPSENITKPDRLLGVLPPDQGPPDRARDLDLADVEGE
jgi:hypothetical protein